MVGAEIFPCRQTDRTKLIVSFRNFTNAPKNYCFRNYGLNACEIITLSKLVICVVMEKLFFF